ncbi:MAG TPA: hypothetical protein VMD59_18350, partial [Acidimicrobiales bacterium]|nr:hypothetical protein [Acidimicrobiales bacterium]
MPAHHVSRPRLLAALTRSPIALVVAGGGYGKTLLAVELSAMLGLATVNVVLGPSDGEAATFVARIVAALTRSRLVDAAMAVKSDQADPRQAVDALAAALHREREAVLVVVDDA